jgi:hypothetical protein
MGGLPAAHTNIKKQRGAIKPLLAIEDVPEKIGISFKC